MQKSFIKKIYFFSILLSLMQFTVINTLVEPSKYLGDDSIRMTAVTEFNHLDAAAEISDLADLSNSDARRSMAAVFDYVEDAGVNNRLDEAKAIWGRNFPSKKPIQQMNLTATPLDVAVSGDGTIIAVAAGTDGLIITYGDTIKSFSIGDFSAVNSATALTNVTSVTMHPTRPWIIVGTDNATATQDSVYAIELSTSDPLNWKIKNPLNNAFNAAVQSVRFSPNGKYLAINAVATTTPVSIIGKIDVASVPTNFSEEWDTSTDFNLTAVPTDSSGQIAWKHNSSAFAVITKSSGSTDRTIHLYSSATPSVIGGTSTYLFPLGGAAIKDICFNHNSKKLAVIDATNVSVVDSLKQDPTKWTLFDIAGSTTITPSLGSGTANLSRASFHPVIDILAVTNANTDTSAFDLHMIDLRAFKTVKTDGNAAWKEIKTDSTPPVSLGYVAGLIDFPYVVEDVVGTGVPAEVKALSWDKAGDKLIIAAPGAANGNNHPKIDILDTLSNDYTEWKNHSSVQYKKTGLSENDITICSISPDGLKNQAVGYDSTAKIPTAIAWSADSKYVFIAFNDVVINNYKIDVYDASLDLSTPIAISSTVSASPINSLAIRTDISTGNDYIAVGLTTTVTDASGQKNISIDLWKFSRTDNSIAQVSSIPTGFGTHTIDKYIDGLGTATVDIPVRVAMNNDKLVTAAKYDSNSSGNGVNYPEIKVWDMTTFFSSETVANLPSVAEKTINDSVAGLTSVASDNSDETSNTWHAIDAEITSVDINVAGTHILSGDDKGRLYLTSISGNNPEHVDVNPTRYVSSLFADRIVKSAIFSKEGNDETALFQADGKNRIIISLDKVTTFSALEASNFFIHRYTTLDNETLSAPTIERHYNTTSTELNLIDAPFACSYYKNHLIFANKHEIYLEPFVNRLFFAAAQTLKDNIDTSVSAVNNILAKNKAKILFALAGIDLAISTNNEAVDVAVVAGLTHLLMVGQGSDTPGAANAIFDALTGDVKWDDVDFERAMIQKVKDFTTGRVHLNHPITVAKQDSDSVQLSIEKVNVDATKVYRTILNNLSLTDNEIIELAIKNAQNKFFNLISNTANNYGFDSAKAVADLDSSVDGRTIATYAYDFTSEHQMDSSDEKAHGGSLTITDHLRRGGKRHFEDNFCKAIAQHIDNYIESGQAILDQMGILPVNRIGLKDYNFNSVAWSNNNKYLVASNANALFFYDHDYKLIKYIPKKDISTGDISVIDICPIHDFLVIGTMDSSNNVIAIDFSSNNPNDWLDHKVTLTNSSLSGAVTDLKFSPDGNHLISTTASAEVKVVDVVSELADWDASTTFSSLPTTSSSSGKVAWTHDSSAVAIATSETAVDVARNDGTNTSASGITGLTLITDIDFNKDSSKLAIASQGEISIVDATGAIDSWSIIHTFSGIPNFENVKFNPSKNLLIASFSTDAALFTVEGLNTLSWKKLDLIKNENAFSAPYGPVRWNNIGNKLAIASGLGIANSSFGIEIINSSSDLFEEWTLVKSRTDFDYTRFLSIKEFDALRLDPTQTVKALAVLNGDYSKIDDDATDPANDNDLITAIVTGRGTTGKGFDDLDVTTVPPVQFVADFAAGLESGIGGISAITDNVEASAVAAALAGNAYAAQIAVGKGVDLSADADKDIIAPSYVAGFINDLLTNGSALPLGSFYALRGDKLKSGPDKDGNSSADNFGSLTSTLHGPYLTLGAYLDALYLDVMAKKTGMLNLNTAVAPAIGGYPAQELNLNEKEAIARAIVLRTLLTGNESETRTYFTASGNIPLICDAVKNIVSNRGTATYTLPSGFNSLNLATKQEIAALTVIFSDAIVGSDQLFLLGDTNLFTVGGDNVNSVKNLNTIIKAAYKGATAVTISSSEKDKLIVKEMALLSGLAAVAGIYIATEKSNLLVSTSVDEISQIGTELANGLIGNGQLRDLTVQDLGSAGHDGICVDLSESMISAVVSCIGLEVAASIKDLSQEGSWTGGIPAPTGAKTAANIGSFACGLAYNQLFNDSLFRGIALTAREFDTTVATNLAKFSVVSSHPTDDEIKVIVKSALGHKTLSRARYEVRQRYTDAVTLPSAPAITHVVNAIVNHVSDILKNPINFIFNIKNHETHGSISEPRTGSGYELYGHPENRGAELAAENLSSKVAKDLAQDIYHFLTDSDQKSGVEGAASHAAELLSY